MIKTLCRDSHFRAAIGAALVFWFCLYLFTLPLVNLAWPLKQPLKFFLLVAIYPTLEEMVFRGLLQASLYKKRSIAAEVLPGISLANIISSLTFVLFHLIYHDWQWAVMVLFPSLVFGYFRDKYDSVNPGIALHIFYNLGYFWLFGSS